MKKNLISVMILAIGVANLVLTSLLLFTVLPETKKANAMIDKVCSAIDLDVNGSSSYVSIDQTETYEVNGGETMTMNLKSDGTGSHYAVLAVSLSLNTQSSNYEKYPATVLEEKEVIIKNDIIQIVGSYTKEEFDADPNAVQDAILTDMQDLFGEDYIVGVYFSNRQTE